MNFYLTIMDEVFQQVLLEAHHESLLGLSKFILTVYIIDITKKEGSNLSNRRLSR